MRDLDKALSDIVAIRSQIAAETAFRGYGPAAIAATGALALLTLAAQAIFLAEPTGRPTTFFACWIATALAAAAIIGVEMRRRAHRHHSGLADAMIHHAIQQFLPAGATGVLLAVVLALFAPAELWLLPGLWQILIGLGVFASVRSLPRRIGLVGGWYVFAGLAVTMLASDSRGLSPWSMGIPFVVGQFLMAAILHFATEGGDGKE